MLAGIRSQIKRRLQPKTVWRIAFARHSIEISRGHQPHPRKCNVCDFDGFFQPCGIPPRLEAQCPSCGSLERHRLLQLWLASDDRPPSLGRTLHFAPENCVARVVDALCTERHTADIVPGRANLTIDIERMALADSVYDTVICSHVLEHVDDRSALSEIYRVLKSDGLLILMAPLVEGWCDTYENPCISGNADRFHHFGQSDHVRFYGADIRARIKDAGFRLREFTAVEPFVHQHSLLRGEKIFLCRKGDHSVTADPT
jgi:SAM-dependent methyltransferase